MNFKKHLMCILALLFMSCISEPDEETLPSGLWEYSETYMDYNDEVLSKRQLLIEGQKVDSRILIYDSDDEGNFTVLFDYTREIGAHQIKGDSLVIKISSSGYSCCEPENVYDLEMVPDSSRYAIRIRNITDSTFELLFDGAELEWVKYRKQ